MPVGLLLIYLQENTHDMAPASSKEPINIQANYKVWDHPETRRWHEITYSHPW